MPRRVKITINNGVVSVNDAETGDVINGVIRAEVKADMNGVTAVLTLVDFDFEFQSIAEMKKDT